MALTLGSGPFGKQSTGTFNFDTSVALQALHMNYKRLQNEMVCSELNHHI